LFEADPGDSLRYTGSRSGYTDDIISAEVAAINAVMRLPKDFQITVEHCGETNAF
jgi:hypothetical protein